MSGENINTTPSTFGTRFGKSPNNCVHSPATGIEISPEERDGLFMRLFSFSGRATLGEYWKTTLVLMVIAALPIIMLIVSGAFGKGDINSDVVLGVNFSYVVLAVIAFVFFALNV
jgi:hypothetical protein